MWDFLRKEMIGFTTDEIESYIENYGFTVFDKTEEIVYATDKYGFCEIFLVKQLEFTGQRK